LYDETILHVPGLHIFPGQKEPYTAEYHIHMRTLSEPQRYMTIVVPVTYRKGEKATTIQATEESYFAAISSKPDPNAPRPTLDVLIPAGTEFIQYAGPDIRGRTKETPEPADTCASGEDRQFLLMLHVASIRATDLERIPREGSLSSDPRDLPAPGVRPTANVARDRLLRLAILGRPGVRYGPTPHRPAPTPVQQTELTCNPIRIEDGEPVVDISSQTVNVNTLLGHGDTTHMGTAATATAAAKKFTPMDVLVSISAVLFAIAVVIFLDKFVFSYVWGWFFTPESAGLIESRTRNFFILKLLVVVLAVSGVIVNNSSS
jgi:hypothetical protein